MCWMGIAAIGYFIAETVHTSRAHRFQHQRDDDDDDNDAQDIVNFRLKVNAFLSLSHDGSRSFDKCLCLCVPSFNTLYFIVQHTRRLPGQISGKDKTEKLLLSDVKIVKFFLSEVREDPWNDKCCSNGFCPNSFSTPPPSSNRTLWGYFFRRKLVNFLKQRF